MIRRSSALVFSLPCLIFITVHSFAQQKDFQSWYEFQAQKDVRYGIGASLEVEQRLKNNSLQYDRTMLTLSGDYGVTGYLDVEAGIRGLLRMNNDGRVESRYRIHLDGTLNRTFYEVDFSLRTRIQHGFDDLGFGEISGNNRLVSRNKLEGGYHIFATRIDLSAWFESFHKIIKNGEVPFYKMRYGLEIGYTLNFRSRISVNYIIDDEFNVVDPLQAYILKVGFSYQL